MGDARASFALTLLPSSGKLLAAAGAGGYGAPVTTAELYTHDQRKKHGKPE